MCIAGVKNHLNYRLKNFYLLLYLNYIESVHFNTNTYYFIFNILTFSGINQILQELKKLVVD